MLNYNMGTVDQIKERMNRGTIVKACPICGSAPELKKWDLGYDSGRGYPGCHAMYYVCSGCGIIKSEETNDIYDERANLNAEQRAAKDWNEVVDYVDDLIEKNRKSKEIK